MPEWKRLPDSELEIMLIIWEARGQISTSDIMQRLKKKKSLQLVQNSLNRLEGKGFVRCEKIGRLNHYTALVPARYADADGPVEAVYSAAGGGAGGAAAALCAAA